MRSRGHSFKRLAVGLLAIFIFSLSSAASAQQNPGGGLGGRPANPNGSNIHDRSWFVYEVEPGQRVTDTVQVINTTTETKQVDLYVTDSLIASGGGFSCEQRVDTRDGLGSWLALSRTRLTLAPGGSDLVNFSFTVPGNADVGEHSGCIVIEDANQVPSPTVTGVNVITRSGVRVYATVPGEIVRNLEISGFSVAKNPNDHDSWLIAPKVKNTGNVSIDAGLSLYVRNTLSARVHFQEGGYTIARDNETTWNFELKRPFWGGWYRANFNVSYDPSAEAKLGVPTDNPLTVLRSQSIWFFSPPTTLGSLAWMILILVALYGYLLYRRHITTNHWIKKSWVGYSVVKTDDIEGLGAKFNIDWRVIAHANDLKPPYTLKEGQKIKVPPMKKTVTVKSKPKPKRAIKVSSPKPATKAKSTTTKKTAAKKKK